VEESISILRFRLAFDDDVADDDDNNDDKIDGVRVCRCDLPVDEVCS
jgi:hypothetical protein